MGTDREKVIRGKLFTWEKAAAEKGRYKGGQKDSQVVGKGIVKCGNPVSGTTQGFLSSSLELAQCCWSRAIIQTCCSGYTIKVGALLWSGRLGWKQSGVEAVPV